MRQFHAGVGVCVALLSVFAGGAAYGSVTFGGQNWDEFKSTNASATSVGGDLQIEFASGTTGGEYWLHLNRVAPDVNVNGTPFISFSFVVDAIAAGDQFLVDIFIDDESGVNPTDASRKNPRHEANFVVDNRGGSLVQYVLGTEKFTLSGSTQQAQFGNAATGGLGVEQTLSIGKLADGSVEYNLDGSHSASSFLKFNYGDTGFEFGDVYLRIRDWSSGNGVAGGGKVTFTDFHTSDVYTAASPVPEPGTMTLLGLGGVGLLGGIFRRRKAAA
ncbi:MAG: PEP-CTERM sorting domain-containing protein [Planctomycetaceae bacterium]